jgi:hypothetical protein
LRLYITYAIRGLYLGNFNFIGSRILMGLGISLMAVSWQACTPDEPPPESGVFKNSGKDFGSGSGGGGGGTPPPGGGGGGGGGGEPPPNPNPTPTHVIAPAVKSTPYAFYPGTSPTNGPSMTGYSIGDDTNLNNLQAIEVSVPAKAKLKIKIRPKIFSEVPPGTPPQMYSKISVFIYLNGQKQDCQMAPGETVIPPRCFRTVAMNVGQDYIIDLSSRVAEICPANYQACQMKIGFFKPNYDYYCFHNMTYGDGTVACNYNGGITRLHSCVDDASDSRPSFCNTGGDRAVGKGHPWGFKILVETDFTNPLP